MTDSGSFVYMAIYKEAMKQGAKESAAKDYAVIGLDRYKRGDFKKASDLIGQMIAAAKKFKKK